MIKNLVFLITKFYLFWILFFAANRVLFLSLYKNQWENLPGAEVFQSLYAGLRLDISTTSYFTLLLIVLLLGQRLIGGLLRKQFSGIKLMFGYGLLLVILSAFINASEAGLYSEWGAKLNAKALSHMLDPSEVLGTASTKHIFLFIGISLFQISLFGWLFKRFFIHRPFFLEKLKGGQFSLALLALVIPALYLARGGLQPIPINISDANFSAHVILNDVAINSDWNLIHSINENRFVMLIMESWSADLIEGMGGLKGVTPFFDELSKEGYLFNNFFANGWTSDQGICALLSASPVFPHGSVINQSDKSRKVTSMPQILKEKGYGSSFHFGGQMSYGNIKAYLLNQKFDKLVEQQDLKHIPSGRLGIHDEYMYDVFQKHLDEMKPPFFSTLFTVSTHSPYDIPREMNVDYDGEHRDYLKSAKYADVCMKTFLNSVKDKDWYDNTLFVVVADHSHKTPLGHHGKEAADDHKIPLLFFGPALNDELVGKENNKLGSQIDLLGTMLPSFDIETEDFKWTKNLMDQQLNSFAPYVYHYGIGLQDENGEYSYIQDRKVERTSSGNTPEEKERIKKECQAFFQMTNEEFIDL